MNDDHNSLLKELQKIVGVRQVNLCHYLVNHFVDSFLSSFENESTLYFGLNLFERFAFMSLFIFEFYDKNMVAGGKELRDLSRVHIFHSRFDSIVRFD